MSTTRIVSAIMASVITILGLFIITEVTSDVEDADGWEYDDYRTMDGVVSASGSLEVLAGNVVHAHDVGAGTLTYADGSIAEVNVEKARLVVFLMTGQSNSTHIVADPSQASPLPPMGTTYYYGTEDDYGVTSETRAFWSLYNSDGEPRVGDKLPSFAATFHEETGKKVYWLCGGWGGMRVETFIPGGTTWQWMYTTVVNGMAAIPSEYFEWELGPYMWIQGESNRADSVSSYKNYFMQMHEAILAGDLGGYVFDHCYISLPRYSDSLNAYDAQVQLAEAHPNTITIACDLASGFTIENGLMNPDDDIHYTQAGDNIIGSALGEYMADVIGPNKDVHGAAKTLIDVIPVVLIAGLIIGIGYKLLIRRNTF